MNKAFITAVVIIFIGIFMIIGAFYIDDTNKKIIEVNKDSVIRVDDNSVITKNGTYNDVDWVVFTEDKAIICYSSTLVYVVTGAMFIVGIIMLLFGILGAVLVWIDNL